MKQNPAETLDHPCGSSDPGSLEVSMQVVGACSDAKAKDITVLALGGLSDLCEYFVIASGRSDRQVQGIANRVLETLDKNGIQPASVEGFEQAHWVVIDCTDVVIHLFYEPMREHYDIESLWAKAQRIKIDCESANSVQKSFERLVRAA